MSTAHAVGWTLASITAAGLTWAAYRGPPDRPAPSTPAPLDRMATPKEWAQAKMDSARLSREMTQARKRAGRPLQADDVEGHDPLGNPWLQTGLPDNPVVPGIGSIQTDCSTELFANADWIYCPTTATFRPGGLPPRP